ncbi:MAG TPA: PaaI family thioesterase [Candidatus Binataceae bacterium]|nr:PaaI family thioesterase [Candidatus Binataceae bacterium]
MTTAREHNERKKNTWVGQLDIDIVSAERGSVVGQVQVRPDFLAPNGFIHGAVMVSLADSLCGSGAVEALPDGATAHTTIELKANLLGSIREGTIECRATMVHGGKATQVWDATVIARESGKTLALFRCTQLILYPTR